MRFMVDMVIKCDKVFKYGYKYGMINSYELLSMIIVVINGYKWDDHFKKWGCCS